MSAFKHQEDGNHYSKLRIQPMQYSMANKLDACQHTIIKYVTRFRDKGGLADLKKARHVIDMLIELEYGNSAESESGWIQWDGGCRPIDSGQMVEVQMRNGERSVDNAGFFDWQHHDIRLGDIIAYRVVKE